MAKQVSYPRPPRDLPPHVYHSKNSTAYHVLWRENGIQHYKGGFRTPQEALDYLELEKEILAEEKPPQTPML